MSNHAVPKSQSVNTEFAQQATQESPGIVGEFMQFLSENKKWWLMPIIVLFVLAGVLMLLSSTGLAPFIYTLF